VGNMKNDKKGKKPDPKIRSVIKNSIKPSIDEAERFIIYLNKRFKLGLPNTIIVNIEETKKTVIGYFRPKENPKHYRNSKKSLNNICLSSLWLKEDPYETIAHEVAHFYNYKNGIRDCTINQYHNKHFKEVAERLLLTVEQTRTRGFAYTKPSKEFKKMLREFKPNRKAFHVFQKTVDKEKQPTRNILYMCSCGVKIRTAKNKNKSLDAVCQYCNTKFMEA
jgi:predicted SprT family Zn-dependent metalloprotease